MDALFIGQTYIDVTFLTDHIPSGDDKTVAQDYAVSFGGNAVTAAFCCAKLGVVPDLLTSLADDWLGRMFLDMAAKYAIPVHGRKVKESSLSFVIPNNGKRAIIRCRDDDYLHPFPTLRLDGCRALHLDGHMADAAIHYAKTCREMGALVSLDGGGVRSNTMELLEHIDVAICGERLAEQLNLDDKGLIDLLKAKGVKIGGVTRGERGMLWYDESGNVRVQPPLSVPSSAIIDTNGAGDVFHGAYMYSYLARPALPWESHFEFARAASTHKIQKLGNEAGLPSMNDITTVMQSFRPAA
ncbi:MAG: sugar kinase [Beijerinckiaceae bacterium]|jgi:sugar/nucleoside kinase (ribokinase family)|nr:sugar kinase [Beijerinckiaceae bacterium]